MISIGKLAKMFDISRTTLLYYDSIGLLKPSSINKAGYRLYNEDAVNKLKNILVFKEIGVPLSDISTLTTATEYEITSLLIKRLNTLNCEIQSIKKQQDIIVKLLKNSGLYIDKLYINKKIWLEILTLAGINEVTAVEWHTNFEKHSPEQHHSFLSLLGMSEDEILQVREKFKTIPKQTRPPLAKLITRRKMSARCNINEYISKFTGFL